MIRTFYTGTVDLILDAIIGYGLQAAPRGSALEFIQNANASPAPILSLDLPSGLDATAGNSPGDVIHPRWTLTLALPKTGLLPEKTGELFLGDLGIPAQVYRQIGLNYTLPFGNLFWVTLATGAKP